MNPQGEGAQFPVRRGPVEQTELVGEVESERKPLVRRNLQERERERFARVTGLRCAPLRASIPSTAAAVES